MACQPKCKKTVVAQRKSCKAKGTGLSHYILADKKKAAKK
jgi:modified peptide precursor CbpA